MMFFEIYLNGGNLCYWEVSDLFKNEFNFCLLYDIKLFEVV